APPGRGRTDRHSDDEGQQQKQEKRLAEREHAIIGTEGIERQGDDLPVGNRQHDEKNTERNEHHQIQDLLEPCHVVHPRCALSAGALPRQNRRARPSFKICRARYSPASPRPGFRRSRSSLPVLKKGTHFSSTNTDSPVRGLRPDREGRFLTEKAPKPRNSTRLPPARASVISSSTALTMFSTSRW